MPTLPNAPYKQQQRRLASRPTLWHGTTRSRTHPSRAYTVDENGTIWRREKYDARFGKGRG